MGWLCLEPPLSGSVLDQRAQADAPFLYPPEVVSAGFRQRSTKAQAGAVGVVCPRVAHDDTMELINSAAIIKAMYVLIPLTHSRLCSEYVPLPPNAWPAVVLRDAIIRAMCLSKAQIARVR